MEEKLLKEGCVFKGISESANKNSRLSGLKIAAEVMSEKNRIGRNCTECSS